MATTQAVGTRSGIVLLPGDVRQFENDAIQTICRQLQKVLSGTHKEIEVGDKDCLKKIIDEMVKHRLDDPTLTNTEMVIGHKSYWWNRMRKKYSNPAERSTTFDAYDQYYKDYLNGLVNERWGDIENDVSVRLVKHLIPYAGVSSDDVYHDIEVLSFIMTTPRDQIMKRAFGETGKLSTHVNLPNYS